jgi:hypothetical protein
VIGSAERRGGLAFSKHGFVLRIVSSTDKDLDRLDPGSPEGGPDARSGERNSGR